MGFIIRGIGTALPERVVTNDDLAARMETSDAWIVERTGIRERRVGGSTASLATDAGRAALERAGVRPEDVDLLVLCTTTPDQTVPATSATVQHALGLQCGAMDLNAACSGFVYGLVAANGFLSQGLSRVLLIGAETLSRITDPDDRSTAILFADGAGAVLLEAGEADAGGAPPGLLGWDLDADGSLQPLLFSDVGSTFRMRGRDVFRNAVRVMVECSRRALERSGVGPDDVKLLVPHQANLRIIETAAKRLGIPMERTAVVLERTGNVSAASIPLALADRVEAGVLEPGDIVLLAGFGAGMTAASAVLRWA